MKDNEPFSAGDGPDTDLVGPPDPVTDSRQLPACTADDEARVVQGASTPDHPDNGPGDEPDEVAPPPDADADAELPGADELAVLVQDVDGDAVDDVGFDDTDTAAETDGSGSVIRPDPSTTPGA
ncbi:hypothetical protein [Angustibacter aerolatus]